MVVGIAEQKMEHQPEYREEGVYYKRDCAWLVEMPLATLCTMV